MPGVFYRLDFKKLLMFPLIKRLRRTFVSKHAVKPLKHSAELFKHLAKVLKSWEVELKEVTKKLSKQNDVNEIVKTELILKSADLSDIGIPSDTPMYITHSLCHYNKV